MVSLFSFRRLVWLLGALAVVWLLSASNYIHSVSSTSTSHLSENDLRTLVRRYSSKTVVTDGAGTAGPGTAAAAATSPTLDKTVVSFSGNDDAVPPLKVTAYSKVWGREAWQVSAKTTKL